MILKPTVAGGKSYLNESLNHSFNWFPQNGKKQNGNTVWNYFYWQNRGKTDNIDNCI